MISHPEVTPDFLVHHEEPTEQERAESKRAVLRSLEHAGLCELPPEEVLERLVLLELHTKFNQHSRAIEQGVRNVLTYLKEHNEELIIDDGAIRDTCVASLTHDIGKTGPSEATPDEQRVTVDLFSYPIEEIGTPQEVTIEKALTVNGRSPQGEIIQSVLRKSRLNRASTMRDFYDKHAWWTEECLRKYEEVFDDHIRVLAASHHLDRGIDPCGIFPELIVEGDTIKEKDLLGAKGRALLALDKYEATITRRRIPHTEAMAVVRDMLHLRFGQDSVMEAILEALDALGAKGEIFR